MALHPHSLVSAIAYGTVAVAANFSNKSAMLAFPFAPNMVLLVQLIVMFFTAQTSRCSGLLHFPGFSLARFYQLLPLSLAYVVHASLVLRSLLYLNVAVYNTLKRMTPVLVLAFKAIHERKMPGAQEVACVCLIVTGCIVAGAGDLSYSASGYAIAMLCAAVQAVYILLAEANDRARTAARHKVAGTLEKPLLPGLMPAGPLPMTPHSIKSPEDPCGAPALQYTQQPPSGVGFDPGAGLAPTSRRQAHPPGNSEEPVLLPAATMPLASLSSSVEVLYYTSLTSVPVLCLAVAASSERFALPHMWAVVVDRNGADWHLTAVWGLAVAWTETALAGTLVWCTECNSGLTTSIVGVLKGVVAVILGLCFMAGAAPPTLVNLGGIAMVLLGGSWYSSLQCLRKPKP